MHIQSVHAEVIGSEVHGLKHLLERLLLALLHVDDFIQVLLHGPLDEAQEMLLVHAGRGVDVSVHLQARGDVSPESRWVLPARARTPPHASSTLRML